jgi:putative hydrolase of the HAD superfamily
MALKAILFDLDDTLVVEEASVEEAFLATGPYARQRYGLDPQALTQSIRQHARRIWQAAPTIIYCRTIGISSWEGLWARFLGDDPQMSTLREWAPAYRREAWASALAEHGVNDPFFAEELSTAFQEERRSRHLPFPEAASILRELEKKYRLGLITNGVPDLQREKLEGADLTRYFDSITISGDIGAGKPDPRIFEVAMEQLATRPETALMVGNSLKRDIAGAQRAGLRAVWVNRSGVACREDITPHAEVRNLSDLLEDRICE